MSEARIVRGAVALLTLGAIPWAAAFADSVAIGQLQLGESNGYQTISFFNNTGGSAGCGTGGSQYLACTGLGISNWTLALTMVNENPGTPGTSYDNTLTSPLVFTGDLTDVIAPFGGSTPYSGGSQGTWQIPLSFGNSDEPACGPTCDYQISEVNFSGTVASSGLPLRLYNGQTYDGADPSTYTVFNAVNTFSVDWVISAADYSALANPAFLSDAADVLISDQAPVSSTPEPGTWFLMAAACVCISVFRSACFSRTPARS